MNLLSFFLGFVAVSRCSVAVVNCLVAVDFFVVVARCFVVVVLVLFFVFDDFVAVDVAS